MATSPCGGGEDAGNIYIYIYEKKNQKGIGFWWSEDGGELVSSGRYVQLHVRHSFS